MPDPVPATVRPATTARPDDLLELTHGLRAELLARGEFLPSSWVEESAQDLRAGRLRGWQLGDGTTGGLAFLSTRPGRAYGHVHVTPGEDAVDRTDRLLGELRDHREPGSPRLDVGLTGLSSTEEDELAERARSRPEERVIVRYALEVPVGSAGPPPALPVDQTSHRIGDIDLRALAALDWLSYQGTADESLVADTPEIDRRVLEEILQGVLGRFLDEASVALVSTGGALTGFLLTGEQTPHRAVFLDLVVHPAARRQGIGRYLLQWGLRAAHALGYDAVRLWATESNLPALALYESSGFRTVGRALIYRFRGTSDPGTVPHPHRSA